MTLAGETLAVLEGPWKFFPGDDPAFAAPDFDDSSWRPVAINAPLDKGIRAPRGWYRTDFNLPDGIAPGVYELDLGRISAGEEVYLNGVKCGSFAFEETVRNSSDRHRRYPVSSADVPLRPGRNVLAVRVKIGSRRGMYEGIPRVRRLDDRQVRGRLGNRSQGASAFCRHISETDSLNEFYPDEKIWLAPRLALFCGTGKLAGVLEIKVGDRERTLQKFTMPLELLEG